MNERGGRFPVDGEVGDTGSLGVPLDPNGAVISPEEADARLMRNLGVFDASPEMSPVAGDDAELPYGFGDPSMEAPYPRRAERFAARGRLGVSGRQLARYVAPIVLLVAVIVLVAVLVSSGAFRGGQTTPVSPGSTPTSSASGSASPSVNGTTYKIKAGDTLSGIAEHYHTSTAAILDLNPTLDPNSLHVGDRITLPASQ